MALKKIGIIGTHGIGKTSLVRRQAEVNADAGWQVQVIEEAARLCPHGINQDMTLDSQRWMVHHQVAAEHQLSGFDGLVICDRTVLDPVVYAIWQARRYNDQGKEGTTEAKMMCLWLKTALAWATTYAILEYHRLIWLRPADPDQAITADGVRATDLAFRNEIDAIFADVLKPLLLIPEYIDVNTTRQTVPGRETNNNTQ